MLGPSREGTAMQMIDVLLGTESPLSEEARDTAIFGVMCIQIKKLLAKHSAQAFLNGASELAAIHKLTPEQMRETMLGSLAATIDAMTAILASDAAQAVVMRTEPLDDLELLQRETVGST